MAAEADPYLVLGVEPTASDAEIRAAYRALVARYHPDLHQGNPLEELASQKMAEINRAHDLISDPAARAAYDDRREPRRSAGPREFSPGMRGRRWAKVIPILVALPLLFRFGGAVVRLLALVGRELLEGVALLRGTPFVAAAVLLAVVALLVLALRRRRRR